MARPTLSVSIITYNHRDFIARAIDSALAQRTDFPVTIHVGDDFSDDGTRDILRAYREAHPDRIVLNLQDHRPPGVPGRVNNITNLKSCSGDYIAMLDGDDCWIDPDKLQRQVDFLEANPGYGGAAHGFVPHFGMGEVPEGPPPSAGESIDLHTADIFDRQLVQTSTFVFRRDLIEFPPWFERISSADYALFLMVARHGPIRFDPEVRSIYQQHAASVTGDSDDASWARNFAHDAPILFEQFPASATFRQRMNLLRARRIAALHDGHYGEAMALAAKLIASDPRAILRWLSPAA
jgi:glycosyltransferase involved in cell wall biosynthesis